MTTWTEVGDAIRVRRKSLGLTRPEAAEVSGVSVSVWQHIETHVRENFGGATLRKMAQALEWPPDAIQRLLAGEDPSAFAEPTPLDERLARIEARLDRLERGRSNVIRLDERANRQLHDDPPARPHAAGSPGDDLTDDDLDSGTDTHPGGSGEEPGDFPG